GGDFPCTAVFCLKYIMCLRSEAFARFLSGRVGYADFQSYVGLKEGKRLCGCPQIGLTNVPEMVGADEGTVHRY
ncbi:hypothetical protein ACQP3F_34465, partial [Escherichia coli]